MFISGEMVTTPIKSYYIETDTTPIRYIIITQQSLPCKHDWVLQLKTDLNDCRITLSEEEIKCMKK